MCSNFFVINCKVEKKKVDCCFWCENTVIGKINIFYGMNWFLRCTEFRKRRWLIKARLILRLAHNRQHHFFDKSIRPFREEYPLSRLLTFWAVMKKSSRLILIFYCLIVDSNVLQLKFKKGSRGIIRSIDAHGNIFLLLRRMLLQFCTFRWTFL